MKGHKLILILVLAFNYSLSQVEGFDGNYVYKEYEITNLSDARVTKIDAGDVEMYIISFGKLKKLRHMTIKTKIEFKNIDHRAHINFGIKFSAHPIYNNKELIVFTKYRRLECLDKSRGNYSLGEYELDIILKPITNLSGEISILINGELIDQKIYDFSDFTQFNDWAIIIGKLKSTPIIKSFNLLYEKEKFVRNVKGTIVLDDDKDPKESTEKVKKEPIAKQVTKTEGEGKKLGEESDREINIFVEDIPTDIEKPAEESKNTKKFHTRILNNDDTFWSIAIEYQNKFPNKSIPEIVLILKQQNPNLVLGDISIGKRMNIYPIDPK